MYHLQDETSRLQYQTKLLNVQNGALSLLSVLSVGGFFKLVFRDLHVLIPLFLFFAALGGVGFYFWKKHKPTFDKMNTQERARAIFQFSQWLRLGNIGFLAVLWVVLLFIV